MHAREGSAYTSVDEAGVRLREGGAALTRRYLVGAMLTMVLVLALSGTASAATGSGYLTPSGSPHGGYAVNTSKCGVCHAVHNAGVAGDGIGSEVLLRSTRAEACTYCHITDNISTKIVYNGDESNYYGADNPYGHQYFTGGTSVTCTACHQVHAAASDMTDNPFLTSVILRKATTGYDRDSDLANNGVPLATDPNDLAVSKWCTKCHTYWPGGDVDNHVLTSADGTHAFTASSYCVSCHASNTVNGVVTTSAFPHFTDGARFLTSSITSAGGTAAATATADPTYDGVCLRCHRNGAGLGVGQTF